MKIEIPLQIEPMQQFDVILEGQYCRIELLQRDSDELYFSLTSNNQAICNHVLCYDRVPMVKSDYRGFVGNIYFEDLKGELSPEYSEFGKRFRLIYGDLPDDPIIIESPVEISYLLQENGFYILQEDGSRIIL